MSTFYGQVSGQASTIASRRGSKNSGLRVSAQSWEGSVVTKLTEVDGEIRVSIEISDDSSMYGKQYFYGTIDQLKETLSGAGENVAGVWFPDK